MSQKFITLLIVCILASILAFVVAIWINLGSLMGPNHPFLSAVHGVYINESGKPELRMIRVDNSGFLGVLPVQKGPAEPAKVGIPPVPPAGSQVLPAEAPQNPENPFKRK